MERIFNDAKDKNVAAVVIYGKSGDTKAYTDAACTKQFKTSALKDAFLKRAIIKIGTDYFVPVCFSVTSNIGSVVYRTSSEEVALVSVAD